MKIEKVARYTVNGQEFQSLKKAESYINDLIGKHIDKMCDHSLLFGTKHKLLIYDYLLAHRKEIARLLLCEYEHEEE